VTALISDRATAPRRSAANWLYSLLDMPAGAILVVFVVVQITCIIASLIFPDDFRYLSSANMGIMMRSVPVLGCLALGAGVLMIAGEFDLSIGSVYTFTAIIMAMLVGNGIDAFIAAPIGLVVGAAIGLINGTLTLRFNLPSFIVTLGGLLFWRGAVLLINGAVQVRFDPNPVFNDLFSGTLFGINAAFIWFIALCLVFWALIHRHKFGNHVFATGGNRQAATAIGVNTQRIKLTAFAIAGFMAAFAGILATTRVGSVQPGQGAGLELQAIAACVIGGISLRGGRGSILGVFLGVMLIFTITDVLLLLRAPGFYLDMFIATLIVVASIFNHSLDRRGASL
jgi:simple sugar transport system permease protein